MTWYITYPAFPWIFFISGSLQLVYYHSGGLWIDPNLYNNGKVYCVLALSGDRWLYESFKIFERFIKPCYNERGYMSWHSAWRAVGFGLYWHHLFLGTDWTMSLYSLSLRRPLEVICFWSSKAELIHLWRALSSQHFADLVAGHFLVRGHTVSLAAWHGGRAMILAQ